MSKKKITHFLRSIESTADLKKITLRLRSVYEINAPDFILAKNIKPQTVFVLVRHSNAYLCYVNFSGSKLIPNNTQ